MGTRIPKLVFLLAFVVLAYGGYEYLRAVVDHAKLEEAVNLLFESPQAMTPAQLQESFEKSAEGVGIRVPAEQIHLSLEDTGEKSQTGRLIEPSGMLIQSKLLTLDASYSRRILGFPKWFSIHRRKVFTYRVEQPMTIPDEIPMD